MCTDANHIVGEIGPKTVRMADWDQEIIKFEAVIDDFNIRGQREQINHPGWASQFNFCPECGASIVDLQLRAPDWKS